MTPTAAARSRPSRLTAARRRRIPALLLTAALVCTPGAAGGLRAQLEHLPWILKYNSGQNVQPIFHGWSRNPGGGFAMHFGYLNRNYVEALHVPVGPGNALGPNEPGGPGGGGGLDRGQPTFFYPRFHNFAFSVAVPSDWGGRELVWSVTVRGRTDRAVAWLQPEWEIGDPAQGNPFVQTDPPNRPPSIAVPAVAPVALPAAATLTAEVADDGLPAGAREVRELAVGQETPPTLRPGPGAAQSPVNLPQLPAAPDRTTARRLPDPRPEGVSVSWIVWRGPAAAAFEPAHSPARDGRTTTSARFARPGTYVLRATATDRMLSATAAVTVTVREP